jgi:hypothetical protein
MESSIVRENLMTREGYTPYCINTNNLCVLAVVLKLIFRQILLKDTRLFGIYKTKICLL